jgi:tRNA uridine 5-carbamoylmethylation protein Kti12
MVIIFCGIPGSGKTTIANLLVKELKGRVKIFTSDKISGSFYKKIPRILKENLNQVDFLILDATFFQKKWRDLVYNLAKGEKVFTIYLDCPVSICVRRNRKRKANIPEKAVFIMAHQMEKPERPDISINTGKIKPNQAVKMILNKIL